MLRMDHKFNSLLGLIIVAAFLSGCSHKVLVPPRIDLKSYGRIGIFQFSCNAQGYLNRFATQKFIESVQGSQPGTPMMELGLLEREPDPQFLKQIKQRFGVDGVIVGNLDISKVRPAVNISGLITSMGIRANVEATLMVKLYETENGATLWTRSAYANESVAQVWLSKDGEIYFDAKDPERAYGGLVHTLINKTTYDFRPYYVRER